MSGRLQHGLCLYWDDVRLLLKRIEEPERRFSRLGGSWRLDGGNERLVV